MLPHFWWTVTDAVAHGSLPGLDDKGVTIPSQTCQPFHGPRDWLPGVPSVVADGAGDVAPAAQWRLKAATYNVTALCNAADEQCIDAGCHRAGLHLVGLQETRRFPGPRSSTQHYTRFASASEGRNLGCQLWVHKHLALVDSTCGQGTVDAGHAVLVHADPRILAVALRVGSTQFGVIVGHAPTSAVSDEEREAWWAKLDTVLQQLPRRAIPVLLLDANARVTPSTPDDTFVSAKSDNHNATCMSSFLQERRLATTPLHLQDGNRPVTWVSPVGKAAQLDYVVLPDELAACSATIGEPEGFIDHNGIDHKILAVSVDWQTGHTASRKPLRFDVKAMQTSWGRATLQRIHARAPPVPWDVHPDTHLQLYNDYLARELASHFPTQVARPRATHISEEQWAVVRARRLARRVQFRARSLRCKIQLHGCFQAWKAQRSQQQCTGLGLAVVQRIRRLAFTECRVAGLIREHTTTFKKLAQRDVAEHTRRAIAEARDRGPAELAHLLRGVMKTGRRYRVPRVQQAIIVGNESLTDMTEIQQALERHFAQPENGRHAEVRDLMADRQPTARPQPLDAHHLPSLSDVVLGMQALQKGRASGISGIPAEVFSMAPLEAGIQVFPLLMKGAVRGQVPLIWRGTQAVALQKPGKPAYSLSSWRNIALHDVCAKGIGKAVRALLCPALRRLSTRGQHGALAKQDIGVPSHFVQGYLRLARAQHSSGAVVFLDGQSAYYSVLRQLLFPLDSQAEEDILRSLLAGLDHDKAQQDAVLASLRAWTARSGWSATGSCRLSATLAQRQLVRPGSLVRPTARDGDRFRTWHSNCRRYVSVYTVGFSQRTHTQIGGRRTSCQGFGSGAGKPSARMGGRCGSPCSLGECPSSCPCGQAHRSSCRGREQSRWYPAQFWRGQDRGASRLPWRRQQSSATTVSHDR